MDAATARSAKAACRMLGGWAVTARHGGGHPVHGLGHSGEAGGGAAGRSPTRGTARPAAPEAWSTTGEEGVVTERHPHQLPVVREAL
ncbi:hypothetical protein [Streptomyces sp. NPDC056921]|uniref:hypothetical protein n=1 Tax=Streptomyces sp. NPDC056921 TaxID=3345966 RepID=UPI003632A9AD